MAVRYIFYLLKERRKEIHIYMYRMKNVRREFIKEINDESAGGLGDEEEKLGTRLDGVQRRF